MKKPSYLGLVLVIVGVLSFIIFEFIINPMNPHSVIAYDVFGWIISNLFQIAGVIVSTFIITSQKGMRQTPSIVALLIVLSEFVCGAGIILLAFGKGL